MLEKEGDSVLVGFLAAKCLLKHAYSTGIPVIAGFNRASFGFQSTPREFSVRSKTT
jgi:hypothetical protein